MLLFEFCHRSTTIADDQGGAFKPRSVFTAELPTVISPYNCSSMPDCCAERPSGNEDNKKRCTQFRTRQAACLMPKGPCCYPVSPTSIDMSSSVLTGSPSHINRGQLRIGTRKLSLLRSLFSAAQSSGLYLLQLLP